MLSQTVLHASHNYYVAGGSDRYFFELGALLEQNGHKVVPFCGASPQNETSEFSDYFPACADSQNPRVSDAVRYLYSADAKRKIESAIAEQNPDIAHLHIYYGKLTSSILGPLKRQGIPIVQSLHEYKLLCPVYTCIRNDTVCEACAGQQFWKALAYRCNRGSLLRSAASACESYISKALGSFDKIDHYIGVSQFMTDKMLSIGVPREKISTVHNFVDCAQFPLTSETGKHVLYFGRLEPTKGLFNLLDAMREHPQLRCVIAGTGSARLALEKHADSIGLKNIEFAGFVSGDALRQLVQQAICTVLPAEWYENCPMSVLESLAYGRPVIGSGIGGLPELINDGDDGIIVEPGNTPQLAAALEALTSNISRAREMGMAGREKVQKEFSPDRHYAQIAAIYSKLLRH